MKTTFLFLALLTASSFTFSKDKITMVSQIEISDTIPVFLKLGDIKPAYFDKNMTSFLLNPEEAAINASNMINSKFPGDSGQLLNQLCETLNRNFNTNKFVAFPIEKLAINRNKYGVEEIDLVKMNRKNIIVASLDAEFGYVYMSGFSRDSDREKTLLSKMQLNGQIMINFFHMHETTLRPDKIASTGAFVYSGYFSVRGVHNKAEELFRFYNPALLLEKTSDPMNSRLEKLAEKENKAYQKSQKD
jgi:hypothetical protein